MHFYNNEVMLPHLSNLISPVNPWAQALIFYFYFPEKYPFISYEQHYKKLTYHQATIDLVHSSLGPIPQHSTTP